MNTPHEIYKLLESKVSRLHPETRDRLLYTIVGFVSRSDRLDVTTLHTVILNHEKRDDRHET